LDQLETGYSGDNRYYLQSLYDPASAIGTFNRNVTCDFTKTDGVDTSKAVNIPELIDKSVLLYVCELTPKAHKTLSKDGILWFNVHDHTGNYTLFNIHVRYIDPPKYYIALTTVFRLKFQNVKYHPYNIWEFVFWYLALGVEHIYFYDNYHSIKEKSLEYIRPLIDAGYVTYHEWPFHRADVPNMYINSELQKPAFHTSLYRYRDTVNWMVQVDPDEFIILNKGLTLPELLSQYDLSNTKAPALGFRNKFCLRKFKNYPDLVTNGNNCNSYCDTWSSYAKLVYRPKLVNFVCNHIIRDPHENNMIEISDQVGHHNHYRIIRTQLDKPEFTKESSENKNFERMQKFITWYNSTTYALFRKTKKHKTD